MIKANKGEWSELYVFLKILADGGIYAADADLNKIADAFFPLVEVLRNENNVPKLYCKNEQLIKIVDARNDSIILELPQTEFEQKADMLLAEIKKGNGSFAVKGIEAFMQSIQCQNIKAGSSDKSDITVVLHDIRTIQNTLFGFSIKSRLGSASTLLNAGKTTNFIYEISGDLSEFDINSINTINTKSKIKDRLEYLLKKGHRLNFVKMESSVFNSNLQVIDSSLPQIIANLLLKYFSTQHSSVKELTEKIANENPLNYDTTSHHPFYTYKVKAFLTDIALGMVPGTPWNGKFDATGGYIIVKECGEIVCYHIYNRNEFQDYLFNITKLETASSSRHEFGSVYEENGKFYIKLNLQIRFR